MGAVLNQTQYILFIKNYLSTSTYVIQIRICALIYFTFQNTDAPIKKESKFKGLYKFYSYKDYT